MKKTLLLFCAAAALFVGCGKRTVTDETHSFGENRWMRFEPEVFKVDIRNTDKQYVISATVTYDTNIFSASELPLVVDFFADSNELHNFMPSIRLKTKKGALRGSSVGQFQTVTDTIDRCRTFNKPGTYPYRIKQGTSKYQIDGISSLNFKVSEL